MLKNAGKEKPQKGLQMPKKPAWEPWITELEIPMEHTERYIAGSSESSIGASEVGVDDKIVGRRVPKDLAIPSFKEGMDLLKKFLNDPSGAETHGISLKILEQRVSNLPVRDRDTGKITTSKKPIIFERLRATGIVHHADWVPSLEEGGQVNVSVQVEDFTGKGHDLFITTAKLVADSKQSAIDNGQIDPEIRTMRLERADGWNDKLGEVNVTTFKARVKISHAVHSGPRTTEAKSVNLGGAELVLTGNGKIVRRALLPQDGPEDIVTLGDPYIPDVKKRQSFEAMSRSVFRAIGLHAEDHEEGQEARRLWDVTEQSFQDLQRAREL